MKTATKLSHMGRGVLTLILIYAAYTETGLWTALSLFMISVGIEIVAAASRQTKITIAVLITVIALLQKNIDAILEKQKNR